MAVKGFVSHAARNRRFTALFLLLYGAVFAAFVLLILSPLPVIFGHSDQSLFIDPLEYLADFWPVALVIPIVVFGWNRYTLAREVNELLAIREVDPSNELRFAGLAETQALQQGLRQPKLGIVETDACNALTVGAFGIKPMIVVTRGLLRTLDDDEIAGVLAHELAHWRLGDTRLLTINQVMMRTATALQANNPIKIERHPHNEVQWHLVIGILYPVFLLSLFIGGLLTMTLWKLSRFANRKVRTGRDFIADAEAVRLTHFPEALETAMSKSAANGWFENAQRFEAMMFAGATVEDGGTHPLVQDRIKSLREVAEGLYSEGRVRGDTRQYAKPPGAPQGFGRRGKGFAAANAQRATFEEWSPSLGKTFFTDPDGHRKWRRDALDWFTWRAEDRRDILGVAADMRLWAYGCLAASFVLAAFFASSLNEYVSHVSGRTYLLRADDYFADFQCSLSHTVQECEKIAEQQGREITF